MIPPSTTITEEGRRTRRTLLWLAGGIISLNVVVWLASAFTSGGAVAGPDGSSFVTTSSGSAAAAGMFERLGFPIEQGRLPLDEAALPSSGTLMLIDVGGADYTPAELHAVMDFMEGGGTVVVGGQAAMVDRLFPDASTWRTAGGAAAIPLGPVLDPDVFSSASLSGFGSFDVAATDTPLWATEDGTVVAVTRPVGQGTFSWVADSAPFHNGVIGVEETSVAVFHLAQAGGPVVFDEYRHGYAAGAGLWQAMSPAWRRMLILAAVTGVLALIAYARRLGPPHDVRRRLGPSRAAYLDAVAGLLIRAGATDDAVGTLRREAHERLSGSTPPGTDPELVAAAAGLDEELTRAVFGDDGGETTLMAVDRALAIINQEGR